MSEQQTTSACPHPEAVGKRWGDPIGEERQAELQGYLDRWAAETDHGERKGPFDEGARLTGADVSWLAEHSGRDGIGRVLNLHLEGAYLNETHLEQARLMAAHLEGANLGGAYLERADLSGAYLREALLHNTRLRRAGLDDANLEKAFAINANLVEAELTGAHLEEAYFEGAQLEGADLRGAWLDSKTVLYDAVFDDKTRLGDIQWSGVGAVNLTRLDWDQVTTLGDEQGVGQRANASAHEAVVRAYRQLAAQLRAQGMSEVADRFLYRSQIRQRRVLWRQRKLGAYLFSVVLAVLAGYGYRLGRIVMAYVTVVAAFALAFLAARYFAGTLIDWEQVGEAAQISLNAIHGRVFFAQLTLDSVQAWIATIESVVGIVIEGVFVAMLIQRFFGR
jgi:Pentapeptide repeats (8 copies)